MFLKTITLTWKKRKRIGKVSDGGCFSEVEKLDCISEDATDPKRSEQLFQIGLQKLLNHIKEKNLRTLLR